MSYDPPFLAIEEVIPEVATFEGEGLVTLEVRRRKRKRNVENLLVQAGN